MLGGHADQLWMLISCGCQFAIELGVPHGLYVIRYVIGIGHGNLTNAKHGVTEEQDGCLLS